MNVSKNKAKEILFFIAWIILIVLYGFLFKKNTNEIFKIIW